MRDLSRVLVYEKSGLAVRDQFRDRTSPCGDYRQPMCPCLEVDDAEPLRDRRKGEDIGRFIDPSKFSFADAAKKTDVLLHSQVARKGAERRRCFTVADDHELRKGCRLKHVRHCAY